MRRPEWMHPADQRILRELDHTEETRAPDELAGTLFYPPDYIADRCRTLAAHGLVQPVGHDAPSYRLRELGVAVVEDGPPPELFSEPWAPQQ